MIFLKEGEKGYCYLNAILQNLKGEVVLYQIVVNKEYSFDTRLYYLTLTELKKFKEEYADSLKFDFKFETNNGSDIVTSLPSIKVLKFTDAILNSLSSTSEDYTGDITSIYDLFLDVANLDGLLLLDSSVEDNLDKDTIEVGIANFNGLRISKSTMTVACSVHDGEGWKTKSLLKIENGRLVSHPFYFAVDTKDEYCIDKYDITKIGKKKILNRDMTLYRWEEQLPIYRHTRETLRVFDSLVVRYSYNLELLTTIIRSCERLIIKVMRTLHEHEGQIPKEESVPYPKRYDRDKKYGITFSLNTKAPSIFKCDDILEDTLRRFGADIRQGKEIPMSEILGAVRANGYPLLYVYSYVTYIQLLSYSIDIQLDMIEYANDYIASYSKQLLFSEIYLYSLRASIYISNYSFGHMYSDFLISGSDVDYNVMVRRCLYESELQ